MGIERLAGSKLGVAIGVRLERFFKGLDLDPGLLKHVPPPALVADSGGLEIAFWSFGSGDPLMLITGLGMPAATWGPLPSVLSSKGYQTIVMDNRDCGTSGVCDDEYTITEMAADAMAVLDALGIEKTYLLGASMGGFIAQEMTISHPHRVERLMLISTGPGIGGGIPPETEVMTAIFNSMDEDPTEVTRNVVGLLTGPGWAEKHPRLMKFAINQKLVDAANMANVERQWTASATFSSWDRLDQIRCPVMILHGDADLLVPVGNGEALASRIPQAGFLKLSGVGHILPLERPAELLNAIGGFFPTGILRPSRAGEPA
ncbi:MAG: alpha/beta fold hydrolase [Actinomycetota bacterium]